MDFSTQLASIVHDLKNKIQLMTPVAHKLSLADDAPTRSAGDLIRLGLEDVNQDLVLLLSLYRLENKLGLQLREVFLSDLLQLIAQRKPRQSPINLSLNCPPDLQIYCDEIMLRSILDGALQNAFRYAKSQIHLSATRTKLGVNIVIADDGKGYRAEMMSAFNFAAGDDKANYIPLETDENSQTGLGLHFAALAVAAHRQKGRQGAIRLNRSNELGGAAFEVFLP